MTSGMGVMPAYVGEGGARGGDVGVRGIRPYVASSAPRITIDRSRRRRATMYIPPWRLHWLLIAALTAFRISLERRLRPIVFSFRRVALSSRRASAICSSKSSACSMQEKASLSSSSRFAMAGRPALRLGA